MRCIVLDSEIWSSILTSPSAFLFTQLIIRSHEGPDAREKRSGLGGMDEGYTIDHVVESGKLITLFSAPDYPQFQVFLVVTDGLP